MSHKTAFARIKQVVACVHQYEWASRGLCSSHQYGWASRWFVFISMAGLVVVCVHQYDWTSHGLCSSV